MVNHNAPPILPLELHGAIVSRRGKRIVGPINHKIEPTGFSIVIGPNGSGKTTFLRMMHGLERLSGGHKNWNINEQDARAHQAYVFQSPVMMRRSVLDNVAYPLIVHGLSKKEARLKARAWIERFGLSDAAERQANRLSGGECQKIALARALIRAPQILFLDEPCANLDGRATREIEQILMETYKSGTRIIMATHDMGQARRLARDIFFIYRGVIHEHSDADVFFQRPDTPEARTFIQGGIVE